MKKLIRGIDIDDLLILEMLLENVSVTESAKFLSLTQPAVSQRIAKMRQIFGDKILMNRKLTKKGRDLAEAAKKSIELIVGAFPDSLGDGRG